MSRSLRLRAGTLLGSSHVTPNLIAALTLFRYEDLFAQDAETPSLVNVVSKAYRRVALYEPGEYEAVLSYNGTTETAYWDVKDMSEVRKTKNVLFYIGDGMTTNMITAARLIAHESKNGRYLSKMAMDKFPVVSLDRDTLRKATLLTLSSARPPDDPLHRLFHY
jgi:alkaline phosphatase